MEKVARLKAISALCSLEDAAFGNDKGSQEAFEAWGVSEGLCDEWDGEDDTAKDCVPPDVHELLLAVGVSPQEIVNALKINHKIFPKELCETYGFKQPKKYK